MSDRHDQPWWEVRRRDFLQRADALLRKPRWTVIQPFAWMDEDEVPGVDLIHKRHMEEWGQGQETADVYFSKGYDPDIPRIWRVMRRRRALISACWFWDNHHLFSTTMHAAMLADINFFAHDWNSSYARNEVSEFGGYVALCPIFYRRSAVRRLMPMQLERIRSDALYGWFNSYAQWPERDQLLRAVMQAVPRHDIALFPHGTPPDEHPFYGLSHDDKYVAWGAHKVALCLSFGQNMTMRIFDALLAGQIPIVPGNVYDLDATIDAEAQAMLPLVRCPETTGGIAAAYEAALARFDAEGPDGIQRRIEYVLANHMPSNRISRMLDVMRTRFGELVTEMSQANAP